MVGRIFNIAQFHVRHCEVTLRMKVGPYGRPISIKKKRKKP